ncbi:MAG: Tyrosine recombinase XerC [bacterium ADurb.BinA186]|jgi:integrase/recombinase XerD|nr:MAG: Tyrosine recombinase XerC [bacterium ADurb.BinA186]
MENSQIWEIEKKASLFLYPDQMKQLEQVLYEVCEKPKTSNYSNCDLLKLFETAKTVEGCSKRSMAYYHYVIRKFFVAVTKSVIEMTTDDVRNYLNLESQKSSMSRVSLDNIRRILSSFFSWLEEEDYIRKSPVKRIHKIKSPKIIKEAFSDEQLTKIEEACSSLRDTVIVELLESTGMRVGELVKLQKKDIDFERKECVVFGKGAKERKVYFDSKTKLHLQIYLSSRVDGEEAAFVSLLKPHKPLEISGVETMLRTLGKESSIAKVHPHRFRRTLATKAIAKGMPIEQVQMLLGHTKIDTTMNYAIVDENNVENSYRRCIG